MTSTGQAWLAARPWLAPIARLQAAVDEAGARAEAPEVRPPPWERYAADHAAGVPLLASEAARLDCADAAADVLRAILEGLGGAPGAAAACRALRDELRERPEIAREAIAWIRGAAAEPASASPGLLRFLGWAALRRVLAPAIRESAPWHDEERWGRGYCPTCGALPPCAHLVADASARHRLLACGCCGTRWRYRRLGCPFCGMDEPDRLRVLEIEGEASLRIDACDACAGYVKTYSGEGDEDLFLADWPTLHLDVVALQRGLGRAGASLYEIPHETLKHERRSEP